MFVESCIPRVHIPRVHHLQATQVQQPNCIPSTVCKTFFLCTNYTLSCRSPAYLSYDTCILLAVMTPTDSLYHTDRRHISYLALLRRAHIIPIYFLSATISIYYLHTSQPTVAQRGGRHMYDLYLCGDHMIHPTYEIVQKDAQRQKWWFPL